MNITNADELAKHRQSYFSLQKTFNPTEFDADDMAEKAQNAGFRYLIYTTVHCDGFINWPSKLTDYDISHTPYQKDLYGSLVKAFRKRGMKVGAYVCPSLWSNNSYWVPDAAHPATNEFALTSTGPVCNPSYLPADQPAKWKTYLTFLHGLVDELITNYAPDTFWFDCMNHPPADDTFLEVLQSKMRAANPNVVVNIRNGAWSDYYETNDQVRELQVQPVYKVF
jgi:alpha-L-fucosidase